MLNPVVETTTFQGIVHVSGAVGGENHERGLLCTKCSNFRNSDLIVGEDFEEVRLKFIICSVDLIDQEDGWHPGSACDCSE